MVKSEKSGLRNTMVASYFRPKVEIWPFRACTNPAIITGTVRSLRTRLWDRYHFPQNAFLVLYMTDDEIRNLYTLHFRSSCNALHALVCCKQHCLQVLSESFFADIGVSQRIRQ